MNTQHTISEQEREFFSYWKRVFTGAPMLSYQRKKGWYCGLSDGGQRYAAEVLAKVAYGFLIEHGSALPDAVCNRGKRIDSWALPPAQVPLTFSRGLIEILEGVYDEYPRWFVPPSLTAADNCIVLFLLTSNKELLRHRREPQLTELVMPAAFLPGLCLFDRMHDRFSDTGLQTHFTRPVTDTDTEALQWMQDCTRSIRRNHDSFFGDAAWPWIVFSLRAFVRDSFVESFRTVLSWDTMDRCLSAADYLKVHWEALSRNCDQRMVPHVFASFCDAMDVLFFDASHVNRIERLFAAAPDPVHVSDKARQRRALGQLYCWVKDLFARQHRAARTSRYDEPVQRVQAGVFKHYFGRIREQSITHARRTLEYLEEDI